MARCRPVGEKVRTLPGTLIERFKDKKCWAGVDLSMTTDLSAVSLVFPWRSGNGQERRSSTAAHAFQRNAGPRVLCPFIENAGSQATAVAALR